MGVRLESDEGARRQLTLKLARKLSEGQPARLVLELSLDTPDGRARAAVDEVVGAFERLQQMLSAPDAEAAPADLDVLCAVCEEPLRKASRVVRGRRVVHVLPRCAACGDDVDVFAANTRLERVQKVERTQRAEAAGRLQLRVVK